MIVRKGVKDHKTLIGWGQLCMVVGILLSALADGRYGTQGVVNLVGDPGTAAALQGFLAGLSVPILGLSIWLNVRGLMLRRERIQE